MLLCLATHAQILIFHEPTATLTDRESTQLFRFIREFREQGGSVFYISHRLDEILDLSDRISVLRDGQFISELDPKTTNKDEMVQGMAGREVKLSERTFCSLEDSDVVLKVEGLTRQGEFEKYPV